MLLLAAPLRALAQFDDPAFLGVMWRSVAWAVLSIVALTAALVWGGSALAPHGGWLGWLGGVLGGVGAAVLAFYFFLPLATVIASLFADRIAVAVERRFYPGLPPARPASLAEQTWDGLALGGRVLGWQAVTLVLMLIPPLAPVAAPVGWIIAAWAVGRGLFVMVAMRRRDRAGAVALYRALRGPVLAQGALITAGSFIPILNLFVPVLGVAAMVHVLNGSDRSEVVR
jgi:CysZ protein